MVSATLPITTLSVCHRCTYVGEKPISGDARALDGMGCMHHYVAISLSHNCVVHAWGRRFDSRLNCMCELSLFDMLFPPILRGFFSRLSDFSPSIKIKHVS